MSYGAVTVFAPLGERVLSHVRLAEGASAGQGVLCVAQPVGRDGLDGDRRHGATLRGGSDIHLPVDKQARRVGP